MMITTQVLQAQVEHRNKLIGELQRELHQMREDYRQMQDLMFAMLERCGPDIKIEVPKFHDHYANAQFTGDMGIDTEGTYRANLQFHIDGVKEETNEPTK